MYFTDIENQQPIIHSISELNQMIGDLLADCFQTLQVIGEISNFSSPRSGHVYFSLKDANTQIRCVFFYGQQHAAHLNLIDGLQIMAHARVRLYKVRGDLQLEIESIEAIGDGALHQKFEMLKTKLAAQGLFDTAHKKALPAIIQTVGVITSQTGAAIHDILSILKRRFPMMDIIIYPTLVQGEGAAQQIAHQIQVANERSECQALIVGRGGGSLEDLWSFNEEIVAQAISKSVLPIISAVGHEIDVTIADLVADIRAATPSAAAELISPDQTIWEQHLQQLETQLYQNVMQSLEYYQQKLNHCTRYLKHPGQHIQNILQQLDGFEERLSQLIKRQLDTKTERLLRLSRALDGVNPLSILSRGYALLKKGPQQAVVHHVQQVKIGETITAQLAHGQLKCIVHDIVKEDN